MNCKQWTDLSIVEQYQLIGKAVHLIQNSSQSFIAISSMVRAAESKGEFEGITILPEPEKTEEQ